MATQSMPFGDRNAIGARDTSVRDVLDMILRPLASLKLTVALLLMGIVLIFVGTLAQYELNMWDVIEKYFRSFLVVVPLQVFFPPSFFPDRPVVPGGFPFPGGFTIGLAMAINLLAAHGVRFKTQAQGQRLSWGWGVLAAGVAVTWLVINSGSSTAGLLEGSWLSWGVIWYGLIGLLALAWLATVGLAMSFGSERKAERWVTIAIAVLLGATLVACIWAGEFDDSSMRILWQLAKATFAGLVLLGGCVMVFDKRAGVVLIHGGIGLMMFGEVFVDWQAVEALMPIYEGQAMHFTQDMRTMELAIVEQGQEDMDDVIVVPQRLLQVGETVKDSKLPLSYKIERWMKNSKPELRGPVQKVDELMCFTDKQGAKWEIVESRPTSGAENDAPWDFPTAVVEFFAPDDTSLGKHMLSTWNTAHVQAFARHADIKVGDKTYEVALRPKRYYKPYSIELIDVRKDDYLGTKTARNYSSDVRVTDAKLGVDNKVHIWMNNPMRFAGETFFQSNYMLDDETGKEKTTLQVVTNSGWMIPYVACMIVAVGLAWHFGITLIRFLRRREDVTRPNIKTAAKLHLAEPRSSIQAYHGIAWVLAAGLLIALLLPARVKPPKEGEFNFYDFGRIPVVAEGRCKPLDSVARNTLRVISNRETAKLLVKEGEQETLDERSAIEWLLDTISRSDNLENYQVFRIDSLDTVGLFDLKRRKSNCYSIAELQDKFDDFLGALKKAHDKDKAALNTYDRGMLDLEKRFGRYSVLRDSFTPVPVGDLPTVEQLKTDREGALQRLGEIRDAYLQAIKHFDSGQPILAIPVKEEKEFFLGPVKEPWQPYSLAFTQALLSSRLLGDEKPLNPTTLTWQAMIVAYAKGDVETFNKEVASYHSLIEDRQPEGFKSGKVSFEARYNYWRPLTSATWCYMLPFFVALLSWLAYPKQFRSIAFWMLIAIFVIHTAGLLGRIYISGRPPVTNLYSSAIYIGWGCVFAAMLLERFYPLGLGTIVSSLIGFTTLWIADWLALEGDTFTVMQAVLDTQFWLATHVVCVTSGYAATFLAGLLGNAYVFIRLFSTTMDKPLEKDIARMIYGTICFALFFSFFGTVLGGLWADDSWGRFWGWDPKENGALIIVLWNAIVLHARWDGMAKERGLALLSIGGNIVTAWSWFGVNQLGIGLHSYGFTEGVISALGYFVLLQLFVVALGFIPKRDRPVTASIV